MIHVTLIMKSGARFTVPMEEYTIRTLHDNSICGLDWIHVENTYPRLKYVRMDDISAIITESNDQKSAPSPKTD